MDECPDCGSDECDGEACHDDCDPARCSRTEYWLEFHAEGMREDMELGR